HGSNRPGSAMRQGHFKLIENFDDGSLELYDLKEDLGETRNLAPELPQQAESMRQQLQAWRDETRAALPTRR
ncbi:MAG TPA: aryl-sulfate sulfohydrolase, partial [Verrucomicrobiales bacterium]|nr:aryl-sulfate sulfohydrolase [Verrucomicrobiales bacterium]